MVKKRSIVISVILSFLTCGLYGLYWIIKVTNEMNTLLYKKDATGGLMSVIQEKVKVRDENLTLVLVHFSEEA